MSMVPEIVVESLRGSEVGDSLEWARFRGRTSPQRRPIPIRKETLIIFALLSPTTGMLLTILTDGHRRASCGKYRKYYHQERKKTATSFRFMEINVKGR